jgi:hypothetical protein
MSSHFTANDQVQRREFTSIRWSALIDWSVRTKADGNQQRSFFASAGLALLGLSLPSM